MSLQTDQGLYWNQTGFYLGQSKRSCSLISCRDIFSQVLNIFIVENQKVSLIFTDRDSLHSLPSPTGRRCPRWRPCRARSVGRRARRCCWLEPTWAKAVVTERCWRPVWRVRTCMEDQSSSAVQQGGQDCCQPVHTLPRSGVAGWRNSLAWRESPLCSRHLAGLRPRPPPSPAQRPPPHTVPPGPQSRPPPRSHPPPGWSCPPWRSSPPEGPPSRMPRRSRC